MSPLAFQDLAKTIRYKPGLQPFVQLPALPMPRGLANARVVIRGEVVCAYWRDGRKILLHYQDELPLEVIANMEEADAKHWFREFIGRFEHHERDEWLLFGEERTFDPHVGGAEHEDYLREFRRQNPKPPPLSLAEAKAPVSRKVR